MASKPDAWADAAEAVRPAAPGLVLILILILSGCAWRRPAWPALAAGGAVLALPGAGVLGGVEEPRAGIALLAAWTFGAAAGRSPESGRWIRWALVIAGGWCAIELAFGAAPVQSGGWPRPGGPSGSPVALAAWMTPAAAWVLAEPGRMRWAAPLILLTGFRAAPWAACSGWAWGARLRGRSLAGALAIGAAGTGAVWLLRLWPAAGAASLAGSDRGHWSEPMRALRAAVEALPWGVGPGRLEAESGQAKSLAIQLAAEYGLAGLAVLAAMLAALRFRGAPGPAAALAALIVWGLMDAPAFTLAAPGGMAMAAWALAAAESERSESAHDPASPARRRAL